MSSSRLTQRDPASSSSLYFPPTTYLWLNVTSCSPTVPNHPGLLKQESTQEAPAVNSMGGETDCVFFFVFFYFSVFFFFYALSWKQA